MTHRHSKRRIDHVVLALTLGMTGCAVETADDAADPSSSFEQAWNDAYEEHQGGKADSTGCSGVLVPDQPGFDRRIALTFDDGPSTTTTPEVLDILARHGIQATFFINGSVVHGSAERALLERMNREGHIVGNHGHEHHDMQTLSASAFDRQIRLTHDIIEGLGESRLFFRFPYGSAGCGSVDQVESHGYAVTGWHIDTADWCYASSTGGVGYCSPSTFRYVPDGYRGDMLGYTLSQAASKQGGVMLFHDVHRNTVDQLDEIIWALRAEGFTFTNLDDGSTFPLLNGQTASASAACLSCIEYGGGAACASKCPEGECRSCVVNGGGQACLSRCGG
ncbi:MAG: polysaccharide deacetylase family protein [Deltaproteobacteria bacterium]|jgi:peptidoglycan/xylan/chitin deacetylase (PgdA/CDA1 family)|nr:polysaccharide deacetylase family protein [Deltaproteobacteria bacterium]MBW2533367.1 polysaccharide deacetylase family protein [Deltaproteobacteria bacterium]